MKCTTNKKNSCPNEKVQKPIFWENSMRLLLARDIDKVEFIGPAWRNGKIRLEACCHPHPTIDNHEDGEGNTDKDIEHVEKFDRFDVFS